MKQIRCRDKKSETLGKFKARIMGLIKINKRFSLNKHDPMCLRISPRLRLEFSQSNEHKFRLILRLV